MSYNPEIKIGDVITQLKTLEDVSIDLIITSPPYYGMRDYDHESQWGNEETINLYIERMKKWGEECKRVLKNTGSLFINIGDKYTNKGLSLIPERLAIALCDIGFCLRNTIIWYKPNHMPSSVKDRFANTYEPVYFFVKDSGKYYTYQYYSNIDNLRITPKTQQKSKKKLEDFPENVSIYDYDNLNMNDKIDKFNKENGYEGKFKNQTINMGKSPGARSSKGVLYSKQRVNNMEKSKTLEINKFIIEHSKKSNKKAKQIDEHFGYKDTASHWLRIDPGRSIPKPQDWFKLKEFLEIQDDTYDDKMTKEHYVLQNVKNNPKGKNPGDLWEIPTEKSTEGHFAMFPTELPRRIITAFCPENGVILDPFAGSGTTGMVAKDLKKKSILIDINPKFENIIKKRCNID
jgi:DNA modification methylase